MPDLPDRAAHKLFGAVFRGKKVTDCAISQFAFKRNNIESQLPMKEADEADFSHDVFFDAMSAFTEKYKSFVFQNRL